MNEYVFISYQREDSDFAEILTNRIQMAGFQTWIDSNKLRAGEDWRAEIDQAVKSAFALIVIMTPEAKASEYVTYEWSFAWGAGVKVIPVVLKSTPLHPRLETLQYLDFTNFNSRPWDKLLAVIKTASNSASTPEIFQQQNILFTKIIDAASFLVTAIASNQNEAEEASPLSMVEKTRDAAKSITRLITPKTSQQLSEAWVLWVDDRPWKNTNVKQALEALGIQFTLSKSTEEALQRISLKDYNVIISDMERPADKRAGYTLWEKLKEKHITTPFIIYSSQRGSSQLAEDLRSGVYGASNSALELLELVVNAINK
jgi:CheY-like chemotaxis protein